jgi:hypothetical protein
MVLGEEGWKCIQSALEVRQNSLKALITTHQQIPSSKWRRAGIDS